MIKELVGTNIEKEEGNKNKYIYKKGRISKIRIEENRKR